VPALKASRWGNVAAFWDRWKALSFWFFVHLCVYLVGRGVFFQLNLAKSYSLLGPLVIQSFWHGLRFDTSAILLLGAPSFIFVYLGFRGPVWKGLRIIFCVLALAPAIVLNVFDAEYFKFTGKRAGLDVLAFQADALAQSRQLLAQYWFLIGLVIVLFGIVGVGFAFNERLLNRSLKIGLVGNQESKLKTIRREFISFVVFSALLFLGIRGGLQRKPLELVHAYTFDQNELNLLALNSTFTFIKSNAAPRPVSVSYFKSQIDAHSNLAQDSRELSLSGVTPVFPSIEVEGLSPKPRKMNVVLVIFESLAREYMSYGNKGESFTPFVDSLVQKSLFFTQAFANGRRSIDAAWSIGAGIPALMDEPIPTGPYKGNKIYGLAQMFSQANYESWFFHGGKNGTMYFDFFARRAGYDHYYGLNEYPLLRQALDFDGSWGIFDEPFLQNMISVLGSSRKPFFSTVFTLSSHNPYPVPDHLKDQFAHVGTHPMHASMRYADYALQKFFEEASKQDWFQNTLFVVTGDHTSITTDVRYQNDLGYYRIPILFYSPSLDFKPKISQKIVEHADLSCTIAKFVGVLDTLGTKAHLSPFCDDMFSPTSGQVVLQSSGFYTTVTPDFWLRRSEDDKRKVFPTTYPGGFELKGEPILDFAVENALENKRRAAVQLFQNGMNDNDFYMSIDDWKK
jgi:phosphoglycerol transferase MdoB-like AlkP superfamily enzyme